jgi:hypothetical protein
MRAEEWIKNLGDGRKVKFIYQELPADGTFITTQIEGNEMSVLRLGTSSWKPAIRAHLLALADSPECNHSRDRLGHSGV